MKQYSDLRHVKRLIILFSAILIISNLSATSSLTIIMFICSNYFTALDYNISEKFKGKIFTIFSKTFNILNVFLIFLYVFSIAGKINLNGINLYIVLIMSILYIVISFLSVPNENIEKIIEKNMSENMPKLINRMVDEFSEELYNENNVGDIFSKIFQNLKEDNKDTKEDNKDTKEDNKDTKEDNKDTKEKRK